MYELFNHFTPHLWAAVIGGSFGGLKVFAKSRGSKYTLKGILENFVDFCIAIIVALTVTSYYFDPDVVSPFIYLGAGVFIGYVGSYTLELFLLLTPKLIQHQLKQRLGIDISVLDKPTDTDTKEDI